jgi:hypothetical protein
MAVASSKNVLFIFICLEKNLGTKVLIFAEKVQVDEGLNHIRLKKNVKL